MNKNKKILIIIILGVVLVVTAFLILQSGKQNRTKNEGRIIILSNETISKIVSFENDTLVFSEMPPELESISPGDTIIVGPCKAAPYGLFRKVTNTKIIIEEQSGEG